MKKIASVFLIFVTVFMLSGCTLIMDNLDRIENERIERIHDSKMYIEGTYLNLDQYEYEIMQKFVTRSREYIPTYDQLDFSFEYVDFYAFNGCMTTSWPYQSMVLDIKVAAEDYETVKESVFSKYEIYPDGEDINHKTVIGNYYCRAVMNVAKWYPNCFCVCQNDNDHIIRLLFFAGDSAGQETLHDTVKYIIMCTTCEWS